MGRITNVASGFEPTFDTGVECPWSFRIHFIAQYVTVKQIFFNCYFSPSTAVAAALRINDEQQRRLWLFSHSPSLATTRSQDSLGRFSLASHGERRHDAASKSRFFLYNCFLAQRPRSHFLLPADFFPSPDVAQAHLGDSIHLLVAWHAASCG